jgi:hypothetical protein
VESREGQKAYHSEVKGLSPAPTTGTERDKMVYLHSEGPWTGNVT